MELHYFSLKKIHVRIQRRDMETGPPSPENYASLATITVVSAKGSFNGILLAGQCLPASNKATFPSVKYDD